MPLATQATLPLSALVNVTVWSRGAGVAVQLADAGWLAAGVGWLAAGEPPAAAPPLPAWTFPQAAVSAQAPITAAARPPLAEPGTGIRLMTTSFSRRRRIGAFQPGEA